MKLVVGLGNPGEKYTNTRHNLGFRVVDELATSVQRLAASWKYEEKFKAEILQLNYTLDTSSYTLLLVKPQTYMNNSGLAVKALSTVYRLPTTDIIVVYDELDLPLGKIRVKKGGSSAGHHGIESIMRSLETDQFIKVRLGIGPAIGPAEEFVLSHFIPQEKPKVKHMIKQAIKAIESLLDI